MRVVTHSISDNLFPPIRTIVPRRARAAWTAVAMPKTAVNEYHFVPTYESQVRLPRQVFAVQSIPKSKRVSNPSNQHLRPGILGFDRSHYVRASGFVSCFLPRQCHHLPRQLRGRANYDGIFLSAQNELESRLQSPSSF